MLKVLHTADWHLGQSFFGFDRDQEHRLFLEWLLTQIQSERPDVLLMSGDVFDTINPSAVAQRRYYNFLANAHVLCPAMQVVVIAGNHDAGARLEAPAELLGSLNISVVGTVSRSENTAIDYDKFLIPLKCSNGAIKGIAIAIPFLRPSDVPTVSQAADLYLDGIRELYRNATQAAKLKRNELCPNGVLIALGHCHLQGGTESRDSERRIVAGGAEALDEAVFDEEVAYVALGHLHKAQSFSGGRIRFCGSPIPLSFAEIRYSHQVLKLTFEASKLVDASCLAVPKTKALVTIPEFGFARIDEVIRQIDATPKNEGLSPDEWPFLEVRVLEDGPEPTRRQRIEKALEDKCLRLASIKIERASQRGLLPGLWYDEPDPIDLKSMNPETLFLAAHKEKYQTDAAEALVHAFREILLQEGNTQ